MLLLNESEVRSLLPVGRSIELLRATFARLASGEAQNHPRRRLILPNRAALHYMAGADGEYYGAKVYSTHPKLGAHFLFLLFRAADAAPLAVIQANYLGQIRTGAATGLATQLLAAPAACYTVGVIGSGFQARTQVEAVCAAVKVSSVRVWSRSEEKRSRFARECAADLKIPVEAVATAEQAVRGAGVVITATYAAEPVIASDWVEPGTLVNAIGSNQPRRRELPSALVQRADTIVVDSVEQARMESGDLLLAPLDEAGWARVVELQDVVAGTAAARRTDGVVIFKSVGLAVEDVSAAAFVYERARETGAGQEIYS